MGPTSPGTLMVNAPMLLRLANRTGDTKTNPPDPGVGNRRLEARSVSCVPAVRWQWLGAGTFASATNRQQCIEGTKDERGHPAGPKRADPTLPRACGGAPQLLS